MKIILGFVVRWLEPLYRAWMKLAHAIGRVNTFLLLTLFYILFLGVAKLMTVLTGKDLLDTRWKDRPSFWKKRADFRICRDAFLNPY